MEYLDYGIRLKKDKFTFFVSYQKKIDLHTHGFLELAYVANGEILHCFEGVETHIRKGDYLIVDYGVNHSYQQVGDEPICVINCLFLPEFIDKTLIHSKSFHQLIQHYLIRMSEPFTVLHPNSFVFHGNKEIEELILKMQREYEEKKPGYLEILRGNLIELVILTMRQINIPSAKSERSCDDIIHYVNENYADRLLLSELAKKMNYSLPYLSRHFKEETGITFSEYVQKVRIEESCRLLANTKKSIIEISQLVGYSDVKFFNQLFKKHKKMTPRLFRKLIQNEIHE